LLNIAIVMAGVVMLRDIPVAAAARHADHPGRLPGGAAPDTMASLAALPLEKQFSTIAGLATISSNTSARRPGAGVRHGARHRRRGVDAGGVVPRSARRPPR
jgi:hypothetical protein